MSARLDLAAVRARLAGQGGRAYWRSLEALAETPEFREMVAREFPRHAAVWPEGVSRRRFLELMAASLGLAGLAGCARSGGEQIAPYARTREPIAPGTPLFYATALTLGGIATGVLVESHTGRPTKVEGNPEHPTSRGATDVFSQAAVLTLYDPDRSAVVTERGRPRGYDAFVRDMRAALAREAERQGAGIRILTRTVTSPTLAEQLRDVLRRYPRARWHQYEPLGPSRGAHAGALAAFGQPMQVRHRLDRAERIVALDADFLGCVPANLGVIADWAARRRIRGGAPAEMNRLYAVESTLSVSGSVADHRLAVRSRDVADVALALAARVGVDVGPAAALAPPPGAAATWIEAAAEDLRGHRGAGLVIAGDAQPGLVHALAHAMNGALGNVGYTLAYAAPLEAEPVDQLESLAALVRDLDAGGVGVLLILGGNPVYDAPADLDVATAIARADLSVHVGLYADETAARCRWHVPEAHELEAWSDARAPDGTVTIAQPLIAPLHGGRSAHEVLEVLGDHPERPGHDIVRAVWQKQSRAADFERFWRQALHRGVVPETGAPARSLVPDVRWSDVALDAAGAQTGALEIVFRPDPKIYDGRFANNGWLQELPHPITKITWDNAAMLAPATAERLGIASEDVVELRYRGHQVAAPAWVLPGHAENSITVPLGYGRRRAGRVGTGVGFDAFALRTSAAPWFDGGLEIVKTGRRHRLAVTSRHHDMHAREPVVSGTLEQYRRDPGGLRERQIQGPGRPGQTPLTLYPEVAYTGYAWGMAIDLTACTGCSACVVSCYAENNIPVVGREQVQIGRIMDWIRVDTYYTGSLDAPRTFHQPVPCMHCEKAPCEVVCPVGATLHSAEGLNDMIYNRCVGTRYCSNNCPYKVRRFNFLQYSDWSASSGALQHNPEVTVRSRGVMEKCTYCVQRIAAARSAAEREGRRIRDGEVVTACQAACPTQAIVFGDLNDPSSHVRRLKGEPLNYALLEELGTQPRTTYLAAIRNPNPAIEQA
jgi:molybdopterin-containing oxidoreductase family iron-sulfur binding subunit